VRRSKGHVSSHAYFLARTSLGLACWKHPIQVYPEGLAQKCFDVYAGQNLERVWASDQLIFGFPKPVERWCDLPIASLLFLVSLALILDRDYFSIAKFYVATKDMQSLIQFVLLPYGPFRKSMSLIQFA
jgi:hypothetical protein